MKSFHLIFCFIILQQAELKAQSSFGPQLGLNISNITESASGQSVTYKSRLGLVAGIVADIGLSDHFFLQGRILYAAKGCEVNTPSVSGGKWNVNYIDMPLSAVYKFNESERNNAKMYLGGGFYMAYALSGSLEANGKSIPMIFGSDASSHMKPLDFGLNFIVAEQYSSGFFLTVQFEVGLANLNPTNSTKMHNINIFLSIGWPVVEDNGGGSIKRRKRWY